MPERMIPNFIMEWMGRYIDQRMAELRQEQIQINWNKVYIEKAVEEIRNK